MTGEYITWIDSDDWVEPEYLEALLKAQAKSGADIVNMGHKGFYTDGNFYVADYEAVYGRYPNYIIPFKDAIHDIIWASLNMVTVWGSLAKRKLWKGVFFPKGVDMEDQGTKFKLYFKSSKIMAIPATHYIYRVRKGSIMNPYDETLEDKIRKTDDTAKGLEVLLYYADVTGFDIDFCFREFLGRMEYETQSNKLNDGDKILFKEYIENYKINLEKYWKH